MSEKDPDIILNLPDFISTPIKKIIGDTCYTSLVAQLNIYDMPCIRLTISKALGIGIILGSSIVKLPQLIKIINHSSTEGLSFESYGLESINYLINIMYNLRIESNFGTWGECLSILVQNLIIMSLIIYYNDKNMASILKLNLGFLSFLTLLFFTNFNLLIILQTLTIPLHSVSKIPQIIKNYRSKSTGKLSKFTLLTYFGGSLARVFTTWVEVKDLLILSSNFLAFLFNGILLGQLIYYSYLCNRSMYELPLSNVKKADNGSILLKLKKGSKLI